MKVPAHAAAPVRLDFAGGWTDVPPYSTREGGVVLAAAIQLFAHAEVAPRDAGYRLVSEDIGVTLDLVDDAATRFGEPASAAARGPSHVSGRRLHADDSLRRAPGVGARKLGSAGCRHRLRTRGRARRSAGYSQGRRSRLPPRGRRGRDSRRPAGPVRRGVRWIPSSRLPRSRSDRPPADAGLLVRLGAGAQDAPVLHGRVPVLGCDHRPGDACL